ncbi:MAG: CHAT domain-containing protein [Chloroflexota bacterium]
MKTRLILLFVLVCSQLLMPLAVHAQTALPKQNAEPNLEDLIYQNLGTQTMSVAELTDFILAPIEFYGPEQRALHNATMDRGMGDRYDLEGDGKAARLRWHHAASDYDRAGQPFEAAEVYAKIGRSHLYDVVEDPTNVGASMIWLVQAFVRYAKVYETELKQEGVFGRQMLVDLAEADVLFDEGYTDIPYGCRDQLPLLNQAQRRYQRADFFSGEARVIVVKMLCYLFQENLFGMGKSIFQLFQKIDRFPENTQGKDTYLAAETAFNRGQYWRSFEKFEEALVHYTEEQNETGIAHATHGIGYSYLGLGNYAAAKKPLVRALDLYIELDFPDSATGALHNLALVDQAAGKFGDAVEKYARIIQISQGYGHPDNHTAALTNLAGALIEQGKYNVAAPILSKADDLQRDLSPNRRLEATILNNRAILHFMQGQYEESVEIIEQGFQWDAMPTQEDIPLALLWLGVQMMMGDLDEALSLYQSLTPLGEWTDLPLWKNEVDWRLQIFSLAQGNYQDALESYIEMKAVFAKHGDRVNEARLSRNIGFAYLLLGDLEKAETHIMEANELFENMGMQLELAETHVSLGVLKLMLERTDDAIDEFQRAQTTSADIGHEPLTNILDYYLTLLSDPDGYLSSGDLQKVRRLLEKPVPFGQTQIWQKLTNIIYELDNDTSDDQAMILQEVESLFELFDQIDSPTWTAFVHHMLALLAINQLDFQTADHHATQAVEQLDLVKASLTVPELETAFLANLTDVYRVAAIAAAFQNRIEDIFFYTEKARAQSFLEQLGNQSINPFHMEKETLIQQEQNLRQQMSEILDTLLRESDQTLIDQYTAKLEALRSDYQELLLHLKVTHPDYASIVEVDVITLAELQSEVLDEDTAIITYFTTGNVLPNPLSTPESTSTTNLSVAWMIDHTRVYTSNVTITSDEIHGQVDFLRETITERDFDQQTARNLYDQLIRPFKPHLDHKNLIIIPSGPLHYLPFAALWNGDEERYLIEEHSIIYAPSASVLRLLQGKREDNPNKGRLLAMGNADNSLQSAEQEVTIIADLFDTTPLTRTLASESQFYTEAPNADIIHLAVHGRYNAMDPLFTHLQLTDDAIHDGRLYVHELYNVDLSETNLAVLSACDTSLGVINNGEELISLTRAFIYAGAPAVMTTLWPIDDQASAALMETFYEQMLSGMTMAEALRHAQLAILAEDEWSSPYYWAAFNLTGDYR